MPSTPIPKSSTVGRQSSTLDAPLDAPQSMVDVITDRLITAIAMGEYLPGSRLPPERELAASLEVARVTVRTALARLADLGLLETVRGRTGGSFVKDQWTAHSGQSVHRTLSARWDELMDLHEAVRLLHGTIARAASEKRTTADIGNLRSRLEDYRSADSGVESQHADQRLHRAIVEAAHNETLQKVLTELESNISLGAASHLWGTAESMQDMERRALADHEALVEAICNQETEQAGTIGTEHGRIDLDLFEEVLKKAERYANGDTTASG